jgi:NDP-sugar pyrophosphorylase family protein/mannose-6-phosphate isomerase-like protein (cupin superfamily)
MNNSKIIYKPWGREEWLELNDRYCYKRIYINAGYKTSFQYHNYKIETNYIISGEAEIWLENDEGIIEKTIMKSGDYFNVKPPKKHRVIALTDIILQEVSTPEVDDVIRIEDDTNRSDGRIESEHKNPAILILSAGLGTRLGDLTKNINKGLLPINNKAILSHIIEKFPINYDFIIAVGYQKESIIEYCKIAHPKHKFIFIDVDNFDGENSGPGYSALLCKKHLQRPFYLTTCDCLIDSELPHLDGNWLGVQQTQYPEKYSTVLADDDDSIKKFSNKGNEGYPYGFIGLAGIRDYDIFWAELERNIKNGEVVSAFSNVERYSNFKIKKLKWLDTGNFDDLQKTRDYLNDKPLSLNKKNNEITYKIDNKFLKYTPDKNIIIKRIKRAETLRNLIPNNFGYGNNFIHYDWVIGKTLYEYDDLNLFIEFLNFLKNKIQNKIKGSITDIKKFYVDKTNDRMLQFLEKFGNSYYTSEYNINGKETSSMKSFYEKLNFNNLNDNPFYSSFHGDLQFDNIIYDEMEKNFKYIDWRDSFGDSTDAGDIYYDLAKLYGGILIPYNMMKNESKIDMKEGLYVINFSYEVSDSLMKFKSLYENWIVENDLDIKKIKLITALIFLNMSPLHDDKFSKMLWFKSLEMFNENEHK